MTMMPYQLTLTSIFTFGTSQFPRKEIVSRRGSGELVRFSYRQFAARTAQLAGALQRLGIQRGERVGTFAWNTHRHLEAYFAVPCLGAVLHTVNIRLFPDQLVYIINHAEDQLLLIDADLLPTIEAIADRLTTVRHFVVLCDGPCPETTLPSVFSYEELLAAEPTTFDWPEDLDENAAAAMCYTSATTGNPKGVTYTHRSEYLHAMAIGLVNSLAISERDSILPFVPMFHVNAWGLPFGAIWFGAKLVLPGPRPDPTVILDLMEREQVTLAAGVPTLWIAALPLLEKRTHDLSHVRAILIGGSAVPSAIIEKYDQLGLPVLHAYGMTETSPIATVCRLQTHMEALSRDNKLQLRARQGPAVPGIELKVADLEGNEIPRDGKSFGQVLMRGPWVANEYYRDERTLEQFRDGWLYSGDIATWDEDGFIQIVDRTRDLVKSGGEWISSVELENAIMAIPGVAEAAVIGIAHPKWQERPLACVVASANQGKPIQPAYILDSLRTQFPSWWIPDRVVFIEEVPKTSVGKFSKRELRARFAELYSE